MFCYSIIIPHKNTPDLLQFCLDSIPVRKDTQVIVVDDNSDPGKVDFDHFPQWNGEHYECYFTKAGKGAGYAQNVGLDHAKGKWVLIVGADDYLLPSISDIMDEEIKTEADIIYFRPKAVLLIDRTSPSTRADAYNDMIDRYIITGDEVELRCRFVSACSRFINRRLIEDNNIRFDEIVYSNDNLFSIKIGVCADRIKVREKAFYCITESDSTLTSHFLKKPGELQIRADAFFRAQIVVYEHGYPIDEHLSLIFLRKLLPIDRKAFVLNFKRLQKMGYKKKWLIHELFVGNSKKAAFKRKVYTFLVTLF